MRYLFATNNQGKMLEIKYIFAKAGLEVISLADFGLNSQPEETGVTFEENAIIKAQKTAELIRANNMEEIAVLSDDSGLCIDALGGIPGVTSADFMGRETPYAIRHARLLEMLANTPEPERKARFVCVIACVLPSGKIITTRGETEGLITKPSGEGGFGYDPIFFTPEYGKTMAELTPAEKNKISHRGIALREMVKLL